MALLSYWPVLCRMGRVWAIDEYYGHGPLIPIVSGVLAWRSRARAAATPATGSRLGLAVVVLGLLLGAIGQWLDVHFISGYSFVILVCGLVLWLYGGPTFRILWFPLVFLFFMVPVGRVLVDQTSNPLQRLATQGAGAGLQLIGLPVNVVGTSLETPEYVFRVGLACSGLKSIIALLTLTVLVAYLLSGPTWKRLLLAAAAVPVALLANVVRIIVIVLIGRAFGERAGESFLHQGSGLLVFLVAFFILVGLGALIGCREIRDDF
ncbi:MAG: exosortase/archaeosortase family protein [Armatimonadota bacterium]